MRVSSVTPAALSRRSLITVALTGAALTGCSSGNDDASPARPGVTSSLAPDVAVATAALHDIRAVQAAVAATTKRFPAARRGLATVSAVHAAHERSLVDAVPERARTPAAPTSYAVPRRRPAALARLAARERDLHTRLDALALRAQSGDFARLLASMGAGVGQQLTRWPS